MESIFLFCCRSCLKGDGADDEFYTRLGLESKHASADDIKKAYKKKSLELHPDRLARRGVTVTPDHNLQFQRLKEAYDVLVDPKKRKMYDAIGANGLKLMENPQDINSKDFINNFQKNRADRFKIALFLAIGCSIIVAMPVLFCLKADGDIDNAPWLAIWTPCWCIDVIMLVSAILFMMEKEEIPMTEEGEPVEEPTPFSTKLVFFLKTASIVLIQILVFARLDHEVDFSWFLVFIPWFVFEGLVIADFLRCSVTEVPEVNLTDTEFTAENDPHEFMVFRMEKEEAHFRAQLERVNARKKVVNCALRAWFAVFLALQLNDTVDWDWGLVMLPVWLIFLGDFVYWRVMKSWAGDLLQGLDLEAVMKGEVDDPEQLIRAQHGQELEAAGSSFWCTLFGPALMAILLVSRLEASTFSTFIILIPVFIVMYCCVCVVGCGFCCLSNMSTDVFDEEEEGSSATSADELMMQKKPVDEEQRSAEIPVIYKPPVASPSPTSSPRGSGDLESAGSSRPVEQYGTFTHSDGQQGQRKEDEVLRSSDVEMDID